MLYFYNYVVFYVVCVCVCVCVCVRACVRACVWFTASVELKQFQFLLLYWQSNTAKNHEMSGNVQPMAESLCLRICQLIYHLLPSNFHYCYAPLSADLFQHLLQHGVMPDDACQIGYILLLDSLKTATFWCIFLMWHSPPA